MMNKLFSMVQIGPASMLTCLPSKCVRKVRARAVVVSQERKCVLLEQCVSLVSKNQDKKSQALSCTPVTPALARQRWGSPGLTGLPGKQ